MGDALSIRASSRESSHETHIVGLKIDHRGQASETGRSCQARQGTLKSSHDILSERGGSGHNLSQRDCGANKVRWRGAVPTRRGSLLPSLSHLQSLSLSGFRPHLPPDTLF